MISPLGNYFSSITPHRKRLHVRWGVLTCSKRIETISLLAFDFLLFLAVLCFMTPSYEGFKERAVQQTNYIGLKIQWGGAE